MRDINSEIVVATGNAKTEIDRRKSATAIIDIPVFGRVHTHTHVSVILISLLKQQLPVVETYGQFRPTYMESLPAFQFAVCVHKGSLVLVEVHLTILHILLELT